jgi:hypothetical protein
VLLPWATELDEVNEAFQNILTPERIRSVINLIPDLWLTGDPESVSPEEKRNVYIQFLETRLSVSKTFVKEANYAREALV